MLKRSLIVLAVLGLLVTGSSAAQRAAQKPPAKEPPPDYFPLPAGASVKAGDNATIQVVELALHGAAGNASLTTSRRVFATRWLGDDARFAERPWEISPPITGGLRPGQAMACDTFPLVWKAGE